jgi:hypothetical protein
MAKNNMKIKEFNFLKEFPRSWVPRRVSYA